MLDFDILGRNLEYHITWTGYDHTEDINRLNILLAKYGLRVDEFADSPTVTTYYSTLDIDSKIKTLLNLEKNFAIAVKDNNCRVYQDGDKLCVEKKGADNEVRFGDLCLRNEFREGDRHRMTIGIDNKGKAFCYDLEDMPHCLVAGYTGSGKSVFLRQLIASLLIKHDEMEIIGVDPKGTEFINFNKLPNFAYIKNTVDAIRALKNACEEMETRYNAITAAKCRDIVDYLAKGNQMKRKLIVIDEFADLMLTGGSQVEEYVVRLAQKSRGAGIHLIIATQRPTADVMTGLIKANIPCRIALSVKSAMDSRIILEEKGAEMLNGHGDMLFQSKEMLHPIRLQGANIRDLEIMLVVYMVIEKNYPHLLTKRVNL